MKPIAPQGEWLRNKILNGQKEIAIIFIGIHAETRAKNFMCEFPFTLYLPFKVSPYNFTWPILNCEIYLIDTSPSSVSFIKSFVMHLFTQGASLIRYISAKTNQTFLRS